MLILIDIPKFYILNDTLLKEKIQFQLRKNNGIPYEMKIRECFVHVDFLVLDMDVDKETPLILGRPFLSTTDARIDVGVGVICFHINGKEEKFH